MNKEEIISFLSEGLEEPNYGFEEEESVEESPKKGIKEKIGSLIDESLVGKQLKGVAQSGGQGLLEGLHKAGRMMGPLPTEESEQEVEQKFEESVDPYFPDKAENFGGRALKRGLKEAPSMMAFPSSSLASILPKSIAAGFLGEGAKELGAPETVQTIAELTAYIGPDIVKKLLESGSNKEIIQAARDFGLKDEQITPLLQSERKQSWLSKLVPKRGRTQNILKETKEGLSQAEEKISQGELAKGTLSPEAKNDFFNETAKLATEKIPHSTIEKVQQDFVNFAKGEPSGERLINLWRKLNKQYPKLAELQQFKGPLEKALKSIDPKLSEDFGKLNNLWSRYFNIAKKLKPNIVSDLVSGGEALGLLHGVYFMNPSGLKAILATQGARIGARELLLNPRLQQLNEKFLMAVNNNKWQVASKISTQIKDQFNKLDKNIEFNELKEEELKNIFGESEED